MKLWQEIGDHLDVKGFNKDYFHTLLKFIDAIENPIELPRILNNLLEIITSLQRLIELYSGFDLGLPLSEWRAICLELRSAPEMREILNATNKKGKMPLKGKYVTNPVYVAVWQRPGSSTDQQTYFQLLAHCLIAVAILRERTDKQKLLNVSKQELDDFKGNINRALRAVRNLSLTENLNTLEALPDLNVAPEELLDILEKRNDDLAPLKVLLKYLLEVRKPPHRHEHSNSQPVNRLNPRIDLPASISVISSNLDPEQEDGTTTFNLFQNPVGGEARAKEIESSGCSPMESCSGAEIVSPRMSRAKSKQIMSPGQKGLNKRRIKTQLAMLNQRLTSRWEILSVYEVSVYLSAIADLIVQKERSVYLPGNVAHGELAALLTTLFWFGQRLDKAVELKIYHHGFDSMNTEPGFVVITEQNGYWWTKPAVPLRKILPNDRQQEQAQSTVSNFAIFSGIGIEQIISTYIKNCRCSRSENLFPQELSVYKKLVSEFLSSVNARHKSRLTVNRVSDYLFDVISRQDGADLTVAMFIIGRENFLGRNPSYYTSLSVTHLQALYQKVCKNVRDRHFKERPRDNQKRIDDESTECWKETDQTTHVGSPFRPLQRTVSNLAKMLNRTLEKAKQADSSALKLMRLHDSMTRYTAFLVAFSTGFRAIRDPFLSAAEIDWDSGFAVLSDKDNEDCYNSRLIWLPPVCLQQLQHFRQHLQNALYRFNILMPGIYSMLDRPRRDAPEHYMFTIEDEEEDEYVAVTLTPKLMGRRLGSVFALPFNSSRHYLRSCLLERGCPIEVINAFMGHFERGEEPWGVYSGLSPLVYRDILMKYLVPLLSDDGWEALSGLKARL